jgi:hypothetical protein
MLFKNLKSTIVFTLLLLVSIQMAAADDCSRQETLMKETLKMSDAELVTKGSTVLRIRPSLCKTTSYLKTSLELFYKYVNANLDKFEFLLTDSFENQLDVLSKEYASIKSSLDSSDIIGLNKAGYTALLRRAYGASQNIDLLTRSFGNIGGNIAAFKHISLRVGTRQIIPALKTSNLSTDELIGLIGETGSSTEESMLNYVIGIYTPGIFLEIDEAGSQFNEQIGEQNTLRTNVQKLITSLHREVDNYGKW